LQVRDDGIGFDLARPAEGLGLPSLRERVRFVGGRLEIVASGRRRTAERYGAADCWSVILGAGLAGGDLVRTALRLNVVTYPFIDYKFYQFLAFNEPFNFLHRGEP
jgi:hypothetical protein